MWVTGVRKWLDCIGQHQQQKKIWRATYSTIPQIECQHFRQLQFC